MKKIENLAADTLSTEDLKKVNGGIAEIISAVTGDQASQAAESSRVRFNESVVAGMNMVAFE